MRSLPTPYAPTRTLRRPRRCPHDTRPRPFLAPLPTGPTAPSVASRGWPQAGQEQSAGIWRSNPSLVPRQRCYGAAARSAGPCSRIPQSRGRVLARSRGASDMESNSEPRFRRATLHTAQWNERCSRGLERRLESGTDSAPCAVARAAVSAGAGRRTPLRNRYRGMQRSWRSGGLASWPFCVRGSRRSYLFPVPLRLGVRATSPDDWRLDRENAEERAADERRHRHSSAAAVGARRRSGSSCPSTKTQVT